MAYDVVLGVWCGLFGMLGAMWATRYAVRGPWRRLAVARVLRVWEPEPGAGWSKGVPAEVGFVDPASGREMLGLTQGGGGRAGKLDTAWPGREITAFARLRRPADFRVVDQPPRPLDGDLSGAVSTLFLAAVPPAARALFGTHSLAAALYGSAGAVVFAFVVLGIVRDTRRGRRRRSLLAAPEHTTARLVDIRESRKPDADIAADKAATPVLAFTTDDGLPVTAVCEYASALHSLRPGDEVRLRYAASDPSVYTVLGPEPQDRPGQPAAGGLGKDRTWVRADGIRVRADRITAIKVSDDGLLLHTEDQAAAITLTAAAPDPPEKSDAAARESHLHRLADELLGHIEGPRPSGRSVLVVYEAGFTVLDLPVPDLPVPVPEQSIHLIDRDAAALPAPG